MKLNPFQLITLGGLFGAIALSGCGKVETASTADSEPAADTSAPAFTGQVHEIKMRGTPKGFFFEPKETTVKRGDKVHFTLVDGGPHNVSFKSPVAPDATRVPDGAKLVLEGGGKLVGALLQAPGQSYDLEFTSNLPAGEYNFVCDPHTMLGMKGKITVTP